MTIVELKNAIPLKLPSLFLAVATVTACTTAVAPTGPTAGAPSSHTPQGYEVITSTAATTSTLGGSAIVAALDATSGSPVSIETVPTTGSTTHNTGRLELNDGTYLFIDIDGPDVNGGVSDGVAGGTVGPVFNTDFTGYDYVTTYALNYPGTPNNFISAGVAGIITNAADMPIAGSASYSGVAMAQLSHYATADYVNDLYLDDGVSTVDVDFASGSATVSLDGFTNITDDNGVTITAAAAAFDQIQGTGLVVSGAHITGGTWVTMSGGSVVNVVGAGQTGFGNGTFFGYDPSISAPDEVGGVVVFEGATANVIGIYIAD
jgi:hypothetical protein